MELGYGTEGPDKVDWNCEKNNKGLPLRAGGLKSVTGQRFARIRAGVHGSQLIL